MRSEFEFIQNIKKKYSLGFVGDDSAVLPKDNKTDMLITSDMLVEDVDFRLEWTTPEFLGHKTIAVSLSDIAAMGGEPKFGMLSIGIPEKLWKTDFVDRFYDGWHKLAAEFSVELAGGDISKTSDKLVIDCTVLGEVARNRAILRSGAKPGDAIFVTGFLGGASAGLHLLENGESFDDRQAATVKHLMLRQLQPLPHIQTAKLLQEYGLPTSMLDVSDGLSSDMYHLIVASGVGAEICKNAIPIDPAIGPATDIDPIEAALHGGEDFELLLTVDQKNFSVAQDLGFHPMGEITANIGMIELTGDTGNTILEPTGYRHF